MKSQLYRILLEELEGKTPDKEKLSNCLESMEELTRVEDDNEAKPIISLHALLGLEDSQTMRIKGTIKQLQVILLIDSGSTYNFIDQSLVKRLRCHLHSVLGASVIVANGDKLIAQDLCKSLK